PMILGEDKSRLSKRHGATSISEYKRQGYLAAALVNYLALLGWSPGNNREILKKESLIKEFSLKRINKTAAIFDINKLNWINSQYIKDMDLDKLTDLIIPYLKEKKYIGDNFERDWLKGLVKLYKTRLSTLEDFPEVAEFFFSEKVHYEQKAVDKFLKTDIDAGNLEKLIKVLEQTEPFDVKTLEENVRCLVAELNIPAGSIIHPARVALTGGTVSPGIFDVMNFLGKERTIKRLSAIAKKIRTRLDMFDKLSGL
ncbi:MAG: glutamate--tRNA ligase, partial [Proteobacteria bacterium]|nr:glutamate--tRNA ligase [Pseudomonadota bacterium]